MRLNLDERCCGSIMLLAGILLHAMPVAAAPCAYVANLGSDTVSVIDGATNMVTHTIPVGSNPDGIAAAAGSIYVANFLSDTVSVIDAFTNTVTATILVGAGPVGVAAGAAVVCIANRTDHTVSILERNFEDGTTRLRSTVPVDGAPEGVALAGAAYVTNSVSQGPGHVAVIDTFTGQITATIPVGVRPNRIAIMPRTHRFAYVTNFGSLDISVIDTAANAVVATIGLSVPPSGIAITSDDRFAYLTSLGSFSVSIIPTATNTVTDTVEVGPDPSAIAMVQGSPLTYVTNFGANTVSVIRRAMGNDVIATIPVGDRPFAVALARSGNCSAPPTQTPTNTPTSTPTLPPSMTPTGSPTSTASSTPSVTATTTHTPAATSTTAPVSSGGGGCAVEPRTRASRAGVFIFIVLAGAVAYRRIVAKPMTRKGRPNAPLALGRRSRAKPGLYNTTPPG